MNPPAASTPDPSPALSDRAAAEPHFYAGTTHLQAGRNDAAMAEFRRALELCPTLGEAALNLGLLLEKQDRYPEALACHQRAVLYLPGRAEAHFALGNACFNLRRFAEAVAAYRTALLLRPDFTPGWLNLGNALRFQNDLDGAVAAFSRVAELNPDSPDAHVNLANAYRAQNRLADAKRACERALALDPLRPEAHVNYAIALLAGGELQAGWPYAEGRHALHRDGTGRKFPMPGWTGETPLRGKTILLHAEQGFGDTLQFIRYVPLVLAQGATVHVEVQPGLVALLSASLPDVASVIGTGDPLPACDCHCALQTLALAFNTSLETIPGGVPYVRIPPERERRWRGFFAATPGKHIGLAWAGNPSHPNDFNRSLTLAEFSALCGPLPGANFHSLKKEMPAADAELLPRLPGVTDLAPHLRDFADTAALVAQLDLVVAVDTSVAHVAAALGKPVWILLPFSPDWRWLLGREDSPWYPSARLFRQPVTGDWASVFRRVRGALDTFVGGSSAGRE